MFDVWCNMNLDPIFSPPTQTTTKWIISFRGIIGVCVCRCVGVKCSVCVFEYLKIWNERKKMDQQTKTKTDRRRKN